MNQARGKFIVIYGINNLGKSTQAKMLVEKLSNLGFPTEYLKYPIYSLWPSGEILNNYLRGGNKYGLSPREAQIIYTLNRTQYEQKLINKLNDGINIIAEDYTGTGLSWGIGAEVDEMFLKNMNSHLLKEDLAFLFDGKRFMEAMEKNHQHETNDSLTDAVRQAHLNLAEEYGWIHIEANLSINEIHEILWRHVYNLIKSNYPIKSIYKPILNAPKKSQRSTLKIKRLSPIAKLPARAYEHDAGFDLYSANFYSIMPGERAIIKTGIKMAIPLGFVGLIWDKGGVARDGLHTIAGVIDSGFRGEVTINLVNLSHDIYNIQPKQKIAQILIQPISTPDIVEEEIKDETDRNQGHFGSSGLF